MHHISEGLYLTDLSTIIHSMFGGPIDVVRCVCTLLVWWWDVAEGKCSVSILLNFHLLMGLCLWAFSKVLPWLYSSPTPLNETRRMEGARVGAINIFTTRDKAQLSLFLWSLLLSMENALGISHNEYSSLLARARRGSLFIFSAWRSEIEPVNLLKMPYECSPQEILTPRLVHMQSPAIFQNYSYIFLSLLGCSDFHSR